MKKSAGILAFRKTKTNTEVLLVHPGGPFYTNKDLHTWTIPKGEPDGEEDNFQAALREFEEETGVRPKGDFMALQPVKQNGGKAVFAWAVETDIDVSKVKSNNFSMEWPPKSGKTREFPEIDKAGWFTFKKARDKILKGQIPLLDELQALTERK